jgi:flagellar motor switch protein FliN
MGIKRATGAFLDAVGQELGRALRDAEVTWHAAEAGPSFQDLQWWSAKLGDGENWIFAGADEGTWTKLGVDASGCIEKILSRELGPGKVINGGSMDVPAEGTRVNFEIQSSGNLLSLFCVLNPGLESALAGGHDEDAQVPRRLGAQAAFGSSLDMLMHVEVPVSVSFGSTRVRMRQLLGLTPGSVVELDQSLGANVEIRVNDCLIARGEVVAVEGNYAVRVLEIVSPKYAAALNGSTK